MSRIFVEIVFSVSSASHVFVCLTMSFELLFICRSSCVCLFLGSSLPFFPCSSSLLPFLSGSFYSSRSIFLFMIDSLHVLPCYVCFAPYLQYPSILLYLLRFSVCYEMIRMEKDSPKACLQQPSNTFQQSTFTESSTPAKSS